MAVGLLGKYCEKVLLVMWAILIFLPQVKETSICSMLALCQSDIKLLTYIILCIIIFHMNVSFHRKPLWGGGQSFVCTAIEL